MPVVADVQSRCSRVLTYGYESLELSVGFQQVLVDSDGVQMSGTELGVRLLHQR